MKTPVQSLLIAACALLLLAASPACAQTAAFTYRGRLTAAGTPANGPHDMQFKLFDAANVGAGVQRGDTKTLSAVAVANGVFTVTLDFGAAVFDGSLRFLEISVRPGGNTSPYTTLSPRQQVASIPYAIQSLNAATAATALTVASGSVVKSLNDLKDNVTLAAGPNATITKSGNTLTIDSKVTTGGGGSSLWSLAGADAYYNAGNVGIGTSTPAHRLSLAGGPGWTLNSWLGAIELPNSSAIGWQANAAGQRFGMGHSGGGFYLFRTASNPGTTGSPALYDFVVNDVGNVGIGTASPAAGIRLDVKGSTLLETGGSGGGFIQFHTPDAETGMTISGSGTKRADVRFDGSTLKLVAADAAGPPSSANGIAITTAGNVGIGKVNPGSKLDVLSATSTAIVGYSTASSGVGVYGESDQFNGVRGVANNVAHGAVVGVHNSGGIGVLGQSNGDGVFGNSLGAGIGVYGRSTTGPAVHADGNATQARDKGGFVKAMAYIDPFLPAAQYVVRCYNSQKAGGAASTAPCGITVERSFGPGQYTLDFGFSLEDRFISMTAQENTGSDGVVVGSISRVNGGRVSVVFERNYRALVGENSNYADTRFHIIVY